MRRRDFIAALGGTAAAWPFATNAQQPMPVIGFLTSGSLDSYVGLMNAFREGLRVTGYVEGQNVAIEARGANGQFDRTATIAGEMAQRQITVFVTSGNGSALAARSASTTIPLVFLSQGDPVTFGLVASLNRPGGNATGVSLMSFDLVAKRVELVRQLASATAPIAVLINPTSVEAKGQLKEVQEAAERIAEKIHVLNASTSREIEAAFATLAELRAGALSVSTDAYLFSQCEQIVGLAARYAIPTIYDRREFAAAGGLICYGTHFADAFRQLGIYTGKILKGANPADLPVEQVTRFELVINLKTAKKLGLTVPPTLLALADDVIE